MVEGNNPSASNDLSRVFKFQNSILNSELKVESPSDGGKGQRQVRGFNFSKVRPTPINEPYIGAVSESALRMIGVTEVAQQNELLAEYLCGNELCESSDPVAHCYCGYQFGHFSGQLGDGRAISLGDIKQVGESEFGPDGTLLDLQLKGAGLTPYSRTADGRAVLRSSIREFLASEAMFHLGVPSTRAASLIVSDNTKVVRDKLYDGNAEKEKCAVVMRIAPTFLRFGSFEIFKTEDPVTHRAGPSEGLKNTMMQPMLDYLILNFYPYINEVFSGEEQKQMRTKVMFEELVKSTAKMVALWQCYGFCHGVLNTDNLSMLGLTIDYGPYGFMENFDPKHICNNSDDQGRYRYEAQPEICKWNLKQLAESLDPILPMAESKAFVDANYQSLYDDVYQTKLADKLGLCDDGRTTNMLKTEAEVALVDDFWSTMMRTGADFTNTFRDLAGITKSQEMTEQDQETLTKIISYCAPKAHHIAKARSPFEDQARLLQILEVQPQLLRLYGHDPDMIIENIEEAKAERQRISMESQETIDQGYREKWSVWIMKYKAILATQTQTDTARATKMNLANPRFILRNFLLQEAIAKAERGDMSMVQQLLDQAQRPFEEPTDSNLTKSKPDWAFKLKCSCSS